MVKKKADADVVSLYDDEIDPALVFKTEPPPTEPILFEIDGERFAARSWMTGAAYLRYARIISKQGLLTPDVVEGFFAEVLPDAEHERFRKYIEDPDRLVDLGVLAQIFYGLVGRYAAGKSERSRPTKPPKPSRPGRDATPDTSTENSGSGGSTSAP